MTRGVVEVTCTKCKFKWKDHRCGYGDCDFDDATVDSEHCPFCKHAKKLGMKIPEAMNGKS